MGVIDGQPVDAATTNPAFLDANADDVALGKIGFHNTDVISGTFIDNIQRAVNTLWTTTGATEATPGTTYSAPASTITDGTSHQTALTALANKFDPTSGHKHTGAAGDAPPVAASSLSSVPLRGYFLQGITLTGVTGGSTNVTSQMTGFSPSAGPTSTGVVVTNPPNRVILRQGSGVNQGDIIRDGSGNEVYGRLTFASGTWTLTYFVLIGGTETPFTFGSSTDIIWYFQQLYNPMVNPPVYSELAIIPSDNVTADVVPATTSLQGKVMLSNTAPPSIAAAGAAGTANATVANADHTHQGVRSLAKLAGTQVFGDITFEGLGGVTITQVGNNIQIQSNSGGQGFGQALTGTVDGINDTFGGFVHTPLSGDSIEVYVDGVWALKGVAWTFSGGNVVFQPGFIPQPDSFVESWYLFSATPVSSTGTVTTEFRTVTSSENTAKQLTLAHTPVSPGEVLVDWGDSGSALVGQWYNSDYSISGNVLSWSGLGLDGLIATGDRLRIHYVY